MSFFTASFKASLQIRRGSWLLLLLLPLLALGAKGLLPARETAAPVRVGVVLPERGGEEFWEKLDSRGGLAVTFLLTDAAEAERQVSTGRWDCALLLPDDFDARLKKPDAYQLVTLLTGPGSTVYPLVRETAAACIAQLITPAIAEDYLLDRGVLTPDSAAEARPRLSETLPEQDRVLVTMETSDCLPLDALTAAERGTDNLLTGLLAIVLAVYALFAAMDLGRWLDSPFARRLLPLRGALALTLPRLASQLLPALVSGLLTLPALEVPGGAPALLCYLLFLGAAALLLSRRRALWTALPVLMPFVPAAGLLLSPVLLDVTLLFPALAPVSRLMPVTLFLRACGGHREASFVLAAGAALILALLWAADRPRLSFGTSPGRCRPRWRT